MSLPLKQILQGDNVEVLKTFSDNCIDLTVTSPPYDNLRTYKGYSFNFEGVAKELYRVTKDGGVVVWVVGDSTIDGSESLNSFSQAQHFKSIGFRVHDTMIYAKDGSSLNDDLRYHQQFEFMFVFSKGKPKTVNLLKDWKNKRAGQLKKPHIRERDGEITYRKPCVVADYGKRGNIWLYSPGYMKSTTDIIAYEHPAIYPEALAEDHIKSWSNEGDVILDPFTGSGTTLKAAEKLNRKWIGIEIAPEYIEIANKRLAPLMSQTRLT